MIFLVADERIGNPLEDELLRTIASSKLTGPRTRIEQTLRRLANNESEIRYVSAQNLV